MTDTPRDGDPPSSPADDGLPADSASTLLVKAKQGDRQALDALFRRYYPVLKRLAHGRLPSTVRGVKDTDDVVQATLFRALRGMRGFEPRWEGAWLAYLRRILFNCLTDEFRRAGRAEPTRSLEGEAIELADDGPGNEDPLVREEALAGYREALAALPQAQRDAVILRAELGWSYDRIGAAVGSPSRDATRMMVKRAIERVARAMGEGA